MCAAAAAATATAAKENQAKSEELYRSTEDLLKFQFMSMSMSYFSALNMMTGLRQVNSDTTASAIKSSAESASSAAASAAAAAISFHKQSGPSDVKNPNLAELTKVRALEEARKQPVDPLPHDTHKWSVRDVGKWLDALSLSQYKIAFEEAAVDGDFLMELRPEDIHDVLGVSHPLHVRKLVIARDRLTSSVKSTAAAAGVGGLVDGPMHLRPGTTTAKALNTASNGDDGGSLEPKVVFSQVCALCGQNGID